MNLIASASIEKDDVVKIWGLKDDEAALIATTAPAVEG
jgi:hypothetical protein